MFVILASLTIFFLEYSSIVIIVESRRNIIFPNFSLEQKSNVSNKSNNTRNKKILKSYGQVNQASSSISRSLAQIKQNGCIGQSHRKNQADVFGWIED